MVIETQRGSCGSCSAQCEVKVRHAQMVTTHLHKEDLFTKLCSSLLEQAKQKSCVCASCNLCTQSHIGNENGRAYFIGSDDSKHFRFACIVANHERRLPFDMTCCGDRQHDNLVGFSSDTGRDTNRLQCKGISGGNPGLLLWAPAACTASAGKGECGMLNICLGQAIPIIAIGRQPVQCWSTLDMDATSFVW